MISFSPAFLLVATATAFQVPLQSLPPSSHLFYTEHEFTTEPAAVKFLPAAKEVEEEVPEIIQVLEEQATVLEEPAAPEPIIPLIVADGTMDSPYSDKYARHNIYQKDNTMSISPWDMENAEVGSRTKEVNTVSISTKVAQPKKRECEWDHSFDFYQKPTSKGLNHPNEWGLKRDFRERRSLA